MTSKTKLDRPWMTLDGNDTTAPSRRDPQSPLVELNKGASRRSFLKGLGLSGAISLAACQRRTVENAIPLLIGTEGVVPGVPVHYASTCTACSASCGLMVTVRDGRPTKLEGHPDHPLSKGGLCARGQADVRSLYDAGRLTKPKLADEGAEWTTLDRHVRSELAKVSAKGLAVYVLAPTLVSPTARRAVERFVKPLGGKLVEYDAGAFGTSAVMAAYQSLDGRAVLPSLDIAAVDLLLTIDADILTTGPESVEHTEQYARRRRACGHGSVDFHHVHVEGGMTLTGAAADERVVARRSERHSLVLALLRALAERRSSPVASQAKAMTKGVAATGPWAAKVKRLASRLDAAAGHALVVTGSRDVTVQRAVALMNRLLESEGRGLSLTDPSHVCRGRDESVAGLFAQLAAGRVGAVITLGGDPVEELENGVALGKALKGLPLSVAITSRPTRTAAACAVVAASHHGLEQWGDAAPRDGLLTVVQPTIRPLFNTRHPILSILRFAQDETTDYREYLRSTWKKLAFADVSDRAFDAEWATIVSRGIASPRVAKRFSAALAKELGPRDLPALAPSSETKSYGGLELEVIEEVGLLEGRFAHNPWVRELPDPLTRVSWLGVARIAPALAKTLAIADGDVVEIGAGSKTLRFPARILPGQHPKVVSVPLGYGVKDGDGGVAARNAHRVKNYTGTVSVKRTKAFERLPLMQEHPSSEDRPIVFQVHATDAHVPAGHGAAKSLSPQREYSPSWQMAVNLDACTGCSACVVACQAENNLPVVGPENMAEHRDMYWLRMDRYFVGSEDDPNVLFEPMLCAQCDNAPCEMVCPVAATVHSADGLNHQAYNRCVGTRYCANNCPYKVRRFNWFDFTPKDPLERLVLNPDVVVRERGVMEKCTFCVQRIQLARIEAKNAEDPTAIEVQTACQQSCPAQAITFGDGSDERSAVSKAAHGPRAFQVLADLGVRPSVTYQARVRRDGKKNGGQGGHS